MQALDGVQAEDLGVSEGISKEAVRLESVQVLDVDSTAEVLEVKAIATDFAPAYDPDPAAAGGDAAGVEAAEAAAEIEARLRGPFGKFDPGDLQALLEVEFPLPDPEDGEISEDEFQRQLDQAWQVCDRFDLQTDIWRGRILRTVRDREKWYGGDGRGSGFLNWLKDREISKSRAYELMDLATSAEQMFADGYIEPDDVNRFSKRAFLETAKAAPEVQQLVSDAARKGDRITRREVRQISDEWEAITSDMLPLQIKEKAADQSLPARYIAPLVKEMQKLPQVHLEPIQEAIAENPDLDTLKQVTSEARYLARYLESAGQVQALQNPSLNLELALEEALRVGCLSSAADLVNQAAQMEQVMVKLFLTWRRMVNLSERLYVDSGSSTPHLRTMLSCLGQLSSEVVETPLTGAGDRLVRLQILSDGAGTGEGPIEEIF